MTENAQLDIPKKSPVDWYIYICEHNDSFSKECLDILCEALSEHKDDLMVIIAGYEDELNETFFRVNPIYICKQIHWDRSDIRHMNI